MNAPPDTPLVREATALARATLSPAVFNHSQRTFLLGAAWASKRRIDFDEEALQLAALFHDFGLLPPHRDP
ncbi:MAG: HD domain-containing protein, partial [Myxococcales bacterium]